jgi:2-oxoglutarate ferredoxin oxidoreductase subunit beta
MASIIKLKAEPGCHPQDALLRSDRFPHIWCPGCGIGPSAGAYAQAMKELDIPVDRQVVVSGIGCSGRVAGYMDIDSFHTNHGRAVPFATGIKVANPELEVTVFSGDGDLFAIGGNHFIHAARRNVDINVICINNFNYGMTGGQLGPTTPPDARTSTSPYGHDEDSFNLPYLAACSGAVFVARWTSLNTLHLKRAIKRAMAKDGFSFIEVISPCPPGFGEPNELGSGVEEMRFYKEHTRIDPKADLEHIGLRMGASEIVLGDFVDIDRPGYVARKRALIDRAAEPR